MAHLVDDQLFDPRLDYITYDGMARYSARLDGWIALISPAMPSVVVYSLRFSACRVRSEGCALPMGRS